MEMVKCLIHILSLTILIFFGGCNYQLYKSGGKSISVEVDNGSFGMNMGPLVDREIRKTLVKSGNQVMFNNKDSDWNLSVKILDHRQSVESYDTNDSILASSFLIQSKIQIVWENKARNLTYDKEFFLDVTALRPNPRSSPGDDQARQSLARQVAKEISLSLFNLP